MTPPGERQELIALIRLCAAAGCRLETACKEVNLSLRTYRRWYREGQVQVDQRPHAQRVAPANKLSAEEHQAILDVCNEPAHASLPPSQIVPRLLDEGRYIASESSFYRVLIAHDQLHRRGRQRAVATAAKPKSHEATGPNQVWSWDITYLATRVKGQFYYLYLFEDIFSRKIVGYEVHEQESGELAAQLIQRCMLKEQCFLAPPVLHSDNGAPMKSLTLKAKLEELCVLPSYSRPSVSNDNAYSESLFRTLKYRPQWPANGFRRLDDARHWVQRFVDWYNHEHRHSKLNFVTPAQRHDGQDAAILAKRRQVLLQAKQANPGRWRGEVRNCDPVGPVTLNPSTREQGKKAA